MKAHHLPNILTILRILLVIPIQVALVTQQFLLALILFLFAGATDALDGFLARRFNWVSRFGSIIDPIADKLLLISGLITLSWLQLIPNWFVLLVISRDLIIVGGACTYHALVGHYQMAPSLASKINTTLQLVLIFIILIDKAFISISSMFIDGLIYVVAAVNLVSLADYVWVWGWKAYSKRV